MSRLGNWKFAASVSEAGACGCLTAAISLTPEKLREDIRRCREATSRPFEVNLTVGMCPDIDEMLDVCLEEGVEVIETSAFTADSYGKRIKEAGRKWIHKTATVKHALHAEKQGADAVILVGLEGTGIKNISQLPTMTTIAWSARQIKVPIIAAGGIGDAHTFLAALALGAEGVMMGTAFLATKEGPISQRHKEKMMRAVPDDPQLRNMVMPGSEEKGGAPAIDRDDYDTESQSMSFAVAYVDRIPTIKEVIEGIIKGAEETLASWEFLRGTK
jgi:nitronate monooxygenase